MKTQTGRTLFTLLEQLEELAHDGRDALADGRIDLAELLELGMDVVQVGGAIVAIAAPNGLFPRLRERMEARRATRAGKRSAPEG